jgi:hypothetical protein
MRFHPTGLIVFAVILLVALFAGGLAAVVILRVGLALFGLAAFLEVVVNMVRSRNMHIRGRLLGLLVDNGTVPLQGSLAPSVRSRKG